MAQAASAMQPTPTGPREQVIALFKNSQLAAQSDQEASANRIPTKAQDNAFRENLMN